MKSQIEYAKELSLRHNSLFMGEAGDQLIYVAPILVQYSLTSDFRAFIGGLMDEKRCGIFLESELSFEKVYRHFRRFLMVKTEKGKQLYFRYYDPEVLPTFLETSSKEQLENFFGSVVESFEIFSSQKGSKIFCYEESEGLIVRNELNYLTQMVD